MKKLGIIIRNSSLARWIRSLPGNFNIKISWKKELDPDEVTHEREKKEWLNKNPKNGKDKTTH
jgi:hypothetical protein